MFEYNACSLVYIVNDPIHIIVIVTVDVIKYRFFVCWFVIVCIAKASTEESDEKHIIYNAILAENKLIGRNYNETSSLDMNILVFIITID